MKIIQITPAHKQARSGNRTTADRWARIFRSLGHQVETRMDYDGGRADAMVAIHAWRSADAVARFRGRYPARPLVVALAGTDINEFIHTDPEPTLASMRNADALICLHDLVGEGLAPEFRAKLHVVYQSAPPLREPRKPSSRQFDVCVIGHLREVKDPLRAAMAVRDLPDGSRLRVTHLGTAHTPDWAERARSEMSINPRYRWLGEHPAWRVRREFHRTQVMVISSRAEGGANVVSEAIVAGVPVIASHISGNVGLLGADYGGYFPVEDTEALRDCLLKAERDGGYLAALTRQVQARARLFRPEEEARRWRELLGRLGGATAPLSGSAAGAGSG